MCGRYVLGESSWAEYHDALSIINPQATKPRFNIAPTQFAPICYASDNTLKSTDARWWFVPAWHKGDVKDWKLKQAGVDVAEIKINAGRTASEPTILGRKGQQKL